MAGQNTIKFIEDQKTLKPVLSKTMKASVNDFLNICNAKMVITVHYDAILIDEAQDFPSIWFSCILEALKDPDNGDLLIVCDGNQGIRPIGSVSWISIGIKAKGRTIHQAYDLDRNYRNTQGILKLASHFTSQNVNNNEDSICIVPVILHVQ